MHTNCGKVTPIVISRNDYNARPRGGDRRLFCDGIDKGWERFKGAISDYDGVRDVHEKIREFFERFVARVVNDGGRGVMDNGQNGTEDAKCVMPTV